MQRLLAIFVVFFFWIFPVSMFSVCSLGKASVTKCITCPLLGEHPQNADCLGRWVTPGEQVAKSTIVLDELSWQAHNLSDTKVCILKDDPVVASVQDCPGKQCYLWCHYGPAERVKLSLYIRPPTTCSNPSSYKPQAFIGGILQLEDPLPKSRVPAYFVCEPETVGTT